MRLKNNPVLSFFAFSAITIANMTQVLAAGNYGSVNEGSTISHSCTIPEGNTYKYFSGDGQYQIKLNRPDEYGYVAVGMRIPVILQNQPPNSITYVRGIIRNGGGVITHLNLGFAIEVDGGQSVVFKGEANVPCK